MKPYQPIPLDTSAIELPESFRVLTEKLAENVHENWAVQSMQEGWMWGKQHSEKAKTHPNLIPYNQLSESEKEYDRRTAMETIKSLIILGYTIEKVE